MVPGSNPASVTGVTEEQKVVCYFVKSMIIFTIRRALRIKESSVIKEASI